MSSGASLFKTTAIIANFQITTTGWNTYPPTFRDAASAPGNAATVNPWSPMGFEGVPPTKYDWNLKFQAGHSCLGDILKWFARAVMMV
jgi:hypothetical protein